MSIADLDIVVNNLQAPAELLENRLCGGASLQVDLLWPDSGNTCAIGSRLTLRASTGAYVRETRSFSGFLSGDPNRVHFGFPDGAELERLEITWPDGARSTLPAPAANTLLTVRRASGQSPIVLSSSRRAAAPRCAGRRPTPPTAGTA